MSNVVTQAAYFSTAGIGDFSGPITQDGVNVYYGAAACGGAVTIATDMPAGCFYGSNAPLLVPLAASECGIFYALGAGSGTPLELSRLGVTYGVPILDSGVGRAVIGEPLALPVVPTALPPLPV